MAALTLDQTPGTPGRVYGHDFEWTEEHPNIDELRNMLYTYDTLSAEALERIDIISPPGQKKVPGSCPIGQRDPYAIIEKHRHHDEVLGRLWNEVTTPPDWVDWEQIKRGQRVVFKYHSHMILGMLFNSLLGGMGASRICETLARTGGFGVNVFRRRLRETFQHFLEVVEDIDSVKPGGNGFVSSVRIRILHATVRRRILRLAAERPGYFDVDAWGVPINDLHQISTIQAYSSAVVLLSLPRQGVILSDQEITDYFALWRWVGYIMGTPVDWASDPHRAKLMMESMLTSEINPSEKSQIMANNILTAESNTAPLNASRALMAALAYRLLGHDMATSLAIYRPNLYYRILSLVQLRILHLTTMIYALLPESLQKIQDKRFLSFSWRLVENQNLGGIGHKTNFSFQYEPEVGKTTEMGHFDSGFQWISRKTALIIFLLVIGMAWVSGMIKPLNKLTG